MFGRSWRRWVAIAALVTLVHVLTLSGLVQVLGGLWLTKNEPEPPEVITTRLIRLPIPAATVRPPRPAPPRGLIAQAPEEFFPSPEIELPDQDSPVDQSDNTSEIASIDAKGEAPGTPMSIPTPPYEQRQADAEDLPEAGAIAIDVFYGDYTKGSKIAKGGIYLNFPSPEDFEIRLVTRAVGWATIFATEPLQAKTSGKLGPGGLQPVRYEHKTPRGKKELLEFDYLTNKISYLSLKKSFDMPKGIQDRLSFMLQLSWIMKIEPERFSLGESIVIPMTTRKGVEDITFIVLSTDHIILPGGVLVPAVHLSSFRREDQFSGRIDVWLDRVDRFLPIRIRFEESRGRVVDMLTVRSNP